MSCPSFDFALLFRTGWLHRHVESWEYVGNAQWRVSLSLDINKSEIDEYCHKYIPSATAPRIINIPILNVRKNAQFTDFSIVDKNGRPINLLLHEMSCHVAFSQLEGAILTLHGDQGGTYGEERLPPLSQEPELSKFLVLLFQDPLPLIEKDGQAVEFGEPGTYEKVKKHIENSIKALDDDPEWQGVSIDSLRERFDKYWERSRVFRYLVSLNVLRRLICVKVDLDKDDFSMVKVSFLAERNIVEEAKQKSPFKRSRGSGRVSLDIDLDGVGVGEICQVLIHAPSGTQFTPCKLKESEKRDGVGIIARIPRSKTAFATKTLFGSLRGLLKRKTPKHRFFVMKILLERDKNEMKVPPEAIVLGSLTPARATVKVQMGWSSNPIGNDKESKGDHLYRKIPVHDSHASVYRMCLNLAPKLGARAWGYLAYFLFSALFAIAICVEYCLTADIAMSRLTLLLTLATIVAMILIAVKEVPFVGGRVFKAPFRFSRVCTFSNVLVLLFVMAHGTEVLGSGVSLGVLSLAALANCLISIFYILWLCWHRCISSWTSAPDSFNVAEIPVYPYFEDQQTGR